MERATREEEEAYELRVLARKLDTLATGRRKLAEAVSTKPNV
jgi:hypothetical protein